MHIPELKRGVFVFRKLSASSDSVVAYLTLGWRLTDAAAEPWTNRFNGFKGGYAPAVRGACAAVPSALGEVAGVLGGAVTVIAAHGHADENLNVHSPVAQLAASIAAPFGWQFAPNALRHTAHEQLSKAGSLDDRETRISGTYRCVVKPPTDRVIIVDDFVTNGSTVREIATAIRTAAPNSSIYGFALGKSERVSWAARFGQTIDNSHIPSSVSAAWDNA